MLNRYNLSTRKEENKLVLEYLQTRSPQVLDQLVKSSMPFIRMEVSRFKRWGQNVGLDWDDMLSQATETFLRCLESYPHRPNGSFYTYYSHAVRKELHHALVKAGLPVSMGSSDKSLSMWAFMNLPNYLGELGYRLDSWIPEAVLEQAGKFYRLSSGSIKDLIVLKRRWGHTVQLDDLPQHEVDAAIYSHISDGWLQGRGDSLSPEDILLAQTPAQKSKQEEEDEILDARREKLRDWMMLIPRLENQILMFRYLLPTQLGSSKPWEWSAIRDRVTRVKMTSGEVESYHNVAISRLQAFNTGDFSLVCPVSLAEQETASILGNLQRVAGNSWTYWLKLLPRRERHLFHNRWRSIPPTPFSYLCDVNAKREDSKLKVSPEQGEQIEKQYIQYFKEFAAGDFSNADTTLLAEELPLEMVEVLLEKFLKGSLDYLILKKKLLTFQTRKMKGGGISRSRGRLEVIAEQRLKGLSQQYGKTLTMQEATQLLRRRYVELSMILCKMAEQEGYEFAAEESAQNVVKEVLSYADKEELEKILQAVQSKGAFKVSNTEKTKLRTSLYLGEVGKELSLDERMILHRMLTLYSEGLSVHEMASRVKVDTGWHPTRLQQFFLTRTTSGQRKFAKENGVRN